MIEARIAEDAAGKFFELRAGMIPGMSGAELEAALAECEQTRVEIARAEFETSTSDKLPF